MTRADLRGSCFRGAEMNRSVLAHADLRDATVVLHDARQAQIVRSFREPYSDDDSDADEARRRAAAARQLLHLRADFTDAAMRDSTLEGADARHANFTGSILEGANFAQARLSGATFHSAVLTGANLRGADLEGADVSDAIFDPEALELVELQKATKSEHVAKSEPDLAAALSRARAVARQPGTEGASERCSPGSTCSDRLLADARLVMALLPGANLHRANLDRARCSPWPI